jgi:hypothetical protein
MNKYHPFGMWTRESMQGLETGKGDSEGEAETGKEGIGAGSC